MAVNMRIMTSVRFPTKHSSIRFPSFAEEFELLTPKMRLLRLLIRPFGAEGAFAMFQQSNKVSIRNGNKTCKRKAHYRTVIDNCT